MAYLNTLRLPLGSDALALIAAKNRSVDAEVLRRPLGSFSLRIIQLRYAAVAVGIGSLEARAELPALPVRIQMLETLVQRRGVDRKLGKGDRGCQRSHRNAQG